MEEELVVRLIDGDTKSLSVFLFPRNTNCCQQKTTCFHFKET